MSVDYIVQYPCAVRQQMQDGALLELIKTRNRVGWALNKFSRDNPGLSAEQIMERWELGVVVRRPDGQQEMKAVPMKQLAEQCRPLGALAPHCKACPASLGRGAFGCVGAVNYPIPGSAEAWLLSRLPDDAKAPGLELLLRFLADFKVDGAPVDSQRGRREVYESPQPLRRKWGGLLSSKTVSSSQMLHLLFHMDSTLEPVVTMLMAKVLDAAREQPAAQEEQGIAQIQAYLRALDFAGANQARLWVDA